MKFTAREDWCLLKIIHVGKVGKIAMPDIAKEGEEVYVAAFGPKVEGLKVGDRVLAIGAAGTVATLPAQYQTVRNETLILTRATNVSLVIELDAE
jgi:NADPH:quinone reductase-like Zn-dependent oxidoreductase